MVTQVFKGITSSRRGERKSTVGNSVHLPSGTNMQDYDSQAFYSFPEYLSVILSSRLIFMILLIIQALFDQYKLIKDENKTIQYLRNTLTFRLVAVKLGYVTYCSATFWPTIRQHYGNVDGKETFRDLSIPFLNLCASCHSQLRLLIININFGKRLEANYVYIYLYIYRVCHCLSSCKWASCPLDFAVKSYTLVYFFSKVILLVRKSHKKNQSIDLIGLAIVEKAYARNRSFLGHNRSYWREWPLVTPWTWPIKEGIEPWKSQIGFSCLMSKVSLLPPLSLSSPSLALVLFVVILLYYGYVLVKGKNSNKY